VSEWIAVRAELAGIRVELAGIRQALTAAVFPAAPGEIVCAHPPETRKDLTGVAGAVEYVCVACGLHVREAA